jgi:DNA primase catalytic core
MSLHRITAGSGYDYLTRQVAAMDSTEKGYTGLASYYTEKGETPGRWVGTGMAGIDGLAAGDSVTAEQMLSLFGAGMHPLAQGRAAALEGTGAGENEFREATRLGQPFRVYRDDISPFRIEIARRLELLNTSRGLPRDTKNSIEDRARVRSEVALALFEKQYGRKPLDTRELAGHIAKLSRQKTTAVAGYDLTFSPVKSVSSLWALADPTTAATIEQAHHSAVAEALAFIERTALYTRTGTNGVRQVDVRGLIGTAFTHRDSRAGDPDLHTHVAVANKVQTLTDGRWLSIDGRVLFKAIVAASETYNTALEQHLAQSLGLRFEERPNPDRRKLPVREVVGIEPALNTRWSQRRQSIESRRRVLAAAFQRDHGRPPTPVEAIALAQQATLETREAKHEPRTLTDQRATWLVQALEVLGGERGLRTMLHRALHPERGKRQELDQQWFDETVAAMLDRMETTRSSWQDWHLHAEAQRQVRRAGVPREQTEAWIGQLVGAVIARSVPITRATDGVAEPEPLRRRDGQSVYTVAGSQLFTSSRVLDAEQRLVTSAGLRGGMVADPTAVDLALLESEANGVSLNPGQVLLVREMAASGARLQLAIAPAGSGKTTAMDALSRAWIGSGGNVVGLAPSAAAAAQLGAQMEGHHDTLAKLVWDLGQHDTTAWNRLIGPRTLVVIDEAGMADTVSLDTAVRYILHRGGSVRLIGDDQQLAAIGAGGVLRDIQSQHGALRLTELVRFSDPAEGSASLALREGHTAALGFYLDQHRIHVGDETTMADDLFDAWSTDRSRGLDSIMLAPTRDRVSELNQRARNQRLAGTIPNREVDLADGNQASAGDTIITRQNNRLLRVAANDWVKNGDRWTVVSVHPKRGIRARHTQSGRLVTLPADYVAEQVELGYASTTHTAQGITADTMHGLLVGTESRQQAYTMLTRGRHHNAAYVVVVGDGDPHTTIRPETVNPLTPTDLLEAILARDESPVSATTALRDAADPSRLLHQAVTRYSDAIGFAAAHIAGDVGIRGLERRVEEALPHITSADGWPSLKAELLLVEADGADPIHALALATAEPVSTVQDPAAVLAWRVADRRGRHGGGPLPWLGGIPSEITQHPLWNPYLTARADLIRQLTHQIRHPHDSLPAWVSAGASTPPSEVIAAVEVWRAATGTPGSDLRPTGERQHATAAGRYQRQLDHRLETSQNIALDEWRGLLADLSSRVLADDFAPTLGRRLSQLSSSGINVPRLIDKTARQGALPDDHAAAALWWRMSRHLTPAVAEAADTAHHLATQWLEQLTHTVGDDTARDLTASQWWPALVTTIERGLQHGWPLDQLIDHAQRGGADDSDPCQTWVWRLSLLTDPVPLADEDHNLTENQPPTDLWDSHQPNPEAAADHTSLDAARIEIPEPEANEDESFDLDAEQELAIEATVRRGLPLPAPTDAEVRAMLDYRDTWHDSPPRERLVHVNNLTADYYKRCFTDSWARAYVRERFGQDLADSAYRPGYAPAGWTSLVNHLRSHRITDQEMLAAGVATRASTGRLIDRFRDRITFPIANTDGAVIGFVGRRHPDVTDEDGQGPKYLNTAETPLFRKGDQFFIPGTVHYDAAPVLVEGPFDAIAVDVATEGALTGVAALGTSLTAKQAAQLRDFRSQPILATDPDPAGRAAAERDYWLLTANGLDPTVAELPTGNDPADLIARGNSEALVTALNQATPLAELLIDDRLAHLPSGAAALQATAVLAAQPPDRWLPGCDRIAEQTGLPSGFIRSALVSMVRAWNTDQRRAAERQLDSIRETRRRMGAVATGSDATARPERVNTPSSTGRPEREGHRRSASADRGPSR